MNNLDFLKIFLVGITFKVFIEFVTILLLFHSYVLMFWLPNQGLNPHPLYWKAKYQPLDCQGSHLNII